MKKKILSIAVSSVILMGCHNDDTSDVLPPTDIIPPTTYIGRLLTSGKLITGEVDCNGVRLVDGTFEVSQETSFNCTLGSVHLGSFNAPSPEQTRDSLSNDKVPTSFDLVSIHGDNVTKVLQSIDSCKTQDEICLTEIDSFDVEGVFNDALSDEAVEAYFASKEEEATDEVGKAPSSHVDDKVVPAVDPDAKNDLNSNFVSANAEATYSYKPSAESKVLTRSKLTDLNGQALVGISYFSDNAVGVTNGDGEFEYLWGDTLTFGIDTFEFGQVRGNQVDYKLTDVTENDVTKANIQALLERYASHSDGKLEITPEVQETFAMYPNVINELINFSLPNGGKLDGSDYWLPNEFEEQFNNGLTATIDQALRQPATFAHASRQPQVLSLDSGTYVTDSLKAIFNNVKTFHVFHDNQGGYGATGLARGNLVLNISNRAFPVMMDRNDRNRLIPFGEVQAWTREGKPYIAEYGKITMPAIPTVNEDTVTYGLPFVTAGEIGSGKVVFMGNSMYPSILSCPRNYWVNGWDEIRISSENQECTATATADDPRFDNGDMQRYFTNLFNWFKPGGGQRVATNIEQGVFAMANNTPGLRYDFFIDESYGFESVTKIGQGDFAFLEPSETPILILQAYGIDSEMNDNSANINDPKLDRDDITALINYINKGGNVLFMDGIDVSNPEPIARLADAAGVSIGGPRVVETSQSNCDPDNKWCNKAPRLNQKQQKEIVVLQRFDDLPGGKPPFTVNDDGTVTWASDTEMASTPFHIPQYDVTDSNGNVSKQYALIRVNNPEERQAAIQELQTAFVGTPVCSNEYEYEFNCIEVRSGTDIVERAYGRSDFERVHFEVSSMVKAANLGTNFTALYNHELYYRTKGKQGVRLSTTELNQAYDNLSIWMWNDNPYRYETNGQDELGFKQAVQFLNCYTGDQHQTDTVEAKCPADLKASLVSNKMIHGEGELEGQLNPSYPLNYMEKPLTRIMLGRSYWDHDITVDTTSYPGRTSGITSNGRAEIQTNGKAVTYSAGNNQSTGFWAPQLQQVTVTGGVKATITVMMADDLTGKPNHETALKRPPRMQTSYDYGGVGLTFTAPYGGLIYIQPKERDLDVVTFNLEGVETAAWWKNGQWVHTPDSATAPIAEIDTGSFIYTTPISNVTSIDVAEFAAEMNRFAEAASDFYGRDETTEEGAHRRFTYPELKEFRHRFVNDVQISIGSAHSGYPVMNSSFNATSTTVPTQAKNDWLLWHEVGHNLASAPFSAPGSTEVTNNLLALYMQELEGRNDNPRMDRIIFDIKKAPMWLKANSGHAWSHGDAGMRLVMFGQLKLWAKAHFKIDDWYSNDDVKPAIYGEDEGWNMFKLMHRKARGDVQGDNGGINYCSSKDTGLSNGDLMMVCSSYVSGYDLQDFFTTWNVGETSMTNPDGTKDYSGGISQRAKDMLAELKLAKPEHTPLAVDSLDYPSKLR